MAKRNNNLSEVLRTIVVYQIYSGIVLKKIGIPGLFEIEIENRNHDEGCTISILKPKEGASISRYSTIQGIAKNCNTEGVIYRVALQDKDGDYYSQGTVSISTKTGAWSSPVSLTTPWYGKPLIIKLIGYLESEKWENGKKSLPNGVEVFDQVNLIVNHNMPNE